MDFRFEDGKLWTYTVYETTKKLTKKDLKELGEYTQGQWSDGIGEGFSTVTKKVEKVRKNYTKVPNFIN